MSLAIDSVGLSQLLAAAVVGSRTRCVRGDTEGCDRVAALARWVQQEDERTGDDALPAGWAGRVRPDQGKPISRIPAPTAGATDLLSRIVGVLCEADRARLEYERRALRICRIRIAL